MRYLARSDADRIADAVVMIRHGDSIGTGFFVWTGVVATCDHVLDEGSSILPQIAWRGRDLDVLARTRVSQDVGPDLALLTVDATDHPVLPLISTGSDFGVDVYSYGFQYTDRGYMGYSFWGLLAGMAIDVHDARPKDLLIIARANVPPGASGAPLFSVVAGGVVGVVKRSNPDGGGYAVPIGDLELVRPGLLEDNRAVSPQPHGGSSIETYVASLLREHSYVTLIDLDRTLKLDDIYVSLSLAAKTVTGSPIQLDATGGLASVDAVSLTKLGPWRDLGGPTRHHGQPDVPLEELISQQRAIILGEPGIGKTTLLRHLLSRMCKGELFSTRVPVFVRLAHVQPVPGAVAQFVAAGYPDHASAIAQASEEGRCVYFLDGLDEVGRKDHAPLESEIERLAAKGNHVYLTCRTAAFPRGLFSSAFRAFECTGFNRYQQRRFVARWFTDRPDVGARLAQDLRDNIEVGEFGRNPLLLSMLVILTESDPAFRLSSRRVDLYGAVLKLFLERRPSQYDGLTRRAKARMLATLSLTLMLEGRETILDDDLFEWLDGYRQSAGSAVLQRLESEQIVAVVLEVDGVLARAGASGIRFLHRTFQEYLAARELAGRDDWLAVATARRADPRWEEVLRLLGSMLAPTDADQLIGVLQSPPGGTEPDALDRLVLAARCASDALAVSNDTLDALLVPLFGCAFDGDLDAESSDGVAALGLLCRAHPYAHDVVAAAAQERMSSSVTLRDLTRYIQLLDVIGNERSTAELIAMAHRFEARARAGDEMLLMLFGSVLLGLGHSTDKAATDLVASQLSSAQSYIAAIAGIALSESASVSVPDLLRSVTDNDEEVQQVLVANLLLTALPSEQVRGYVSGAFADSRLRLRQLVTRQALDPRAMEPDAQFVDALLAACRTDLDCAALVGIPSLMAYADHEAILESLVFDERRDPALRCAAVDTLLRLNAERGPDVLNRLLSAAPPALCSSAIAALTRVGSVDAHAMLAARVGPESDGWLVESTLRLFTAVPSPIAEDCLLRLLAAATDDSERRIRIVLALASMGSPAVETYIASQLDGTAASLRERCIAYGTLGWFEAARATPIVLEQLPTETDPHVIACGIESLGELAGDSAEAFLLRALDPAQWPPVWPQRQPPPQQGDQRPSDRRCLAAVIALNRIGSVAALPELERMAQDPDEAPEVRQAAFIAARTIAWNANSQGDTPVVRPRPSVI